MKLGQMQITQYFEFNGKQYKLIAYSGPIYNRVNDTIMHVYQCDSEDNQTIFLPESTEVKIAQLQLSELRPGDTFKVPHNDFIYKLVEVCENVDMFVVCTDDNYYVIKNKLVIPC